MALGQATLTKVGLICMTHAVVSRCNAWLVLRQANEITKSLSKQSALLLASAAKPPQSSASPAAARQKKQQ